VEPSGLECVCSAAEGEDDEDEEDDEDDEDDEDGAPRLAASRLKVALEELLGDAPALVAPARLGAAAAAGLSLSADIEISGRTTLRPLVRLALLFAVLHSQLLVLASFDDTIDHLGALGRLLPHGVVGVALGACAPHDLSLLLGRFGKASEKSLKLAQARGAHPIRGAARELARVAGFVALELL
jgi:hypothetical protein